MRKGETKQGVIIIIIILLHHCCCGTAQYRHLYRNTHELQGHNRIQVAICLFFLFLFFSFLYLSGHPTIVLIQYSVVRTGSLLLKKVHMLLFRTCVMKIRLSTDRLFEDHFLAAEALTLGISETIVF